ncbi:6439_t:CDS:2, partial [Dentiscutata erythropus]
DSSVKLTVVDYNYRRRKWNNDKKKQLDILPSFYPKGNLENFIAHCEILENDDFITITRIGVFIWTYKLSDIKMHYYWNDCNDRLEKFVFEKMKLKILTENWTSGRILPASSYETIRDNLDIKFGENELFKEFLENNIDDEFYLACYGKDIMEALILLRDDKWIRRLGHSLMEKFVKDKNHLISKISLLSIIFENFEELSENHPAFIASTLSKIGFVVPSAIVNSKSISSHLSGYGKYYYLSKTSYFDILISNLWVRWISFQESFKNRFQNFQEKYPLFKNLIVKPVIDFYVVGHIYTQKDKWTGYKKPYISKNLNEVLLLPEEEPSLKDIEDAIEDLKNKIKKTDGYGLTWTEQNNNVLNM